LSKERQYWRNIDPSLSLTQVKKYKNKSTQNMHKAIIYIVLLLQVKTDKVSTSFRENGVERVITTIRCQATISSDSLL
jgi:hypothetical protein